jgi:hypothetical protein
MELATALSVPSTPGTHVLDFPKYEAKPESQNVWVPDCLRLLVGIVSVHSVSAQ